MYIYAICRGHVIRLSDIEVKISREKYGCVRATGFACGGFCVRRVLRAAGECASPVYIVNISRSGK